MVKIRELSATPSFDIPYLLTEAEREDRFMTTLVNFIAAALTALLLVGCLTVVVGTVLRQSR